MNTTFTGLASSLLLNVGLTSFAEKLDPMQNQAGNAMAFRLSSEPCVSCIASNFTPEAGQ